MKVALEITNVSEFQWPAGLSFKLAGSKELKNVIAECELKRSTERSETTQIFWEFSNNPCTEEQTKNDLEGLLQVFKSLDSDINSEEGLAFFVKCSITKERLKFISNPFKLTWEQFDLSYEVSDFEKDYLLPYDFTEDPNENA